MFRGQRWAGFKVVLLILQSLVMLVSPLGVTAALGNSSPLDDVAYSQEVSAEISLPVPFTIILPDEDSARLCDYNLRPEGNLYRAPNTAFIEEYVASLGWSDRCPDKALTVTARVSDWVPGTSPISTPCRKTQTAIVTCAAEQDVRYFSSNGISTRPVSNISMVWRLLTGTKERACFSWQAVIVYGTVLIDPSQGKPAPCSRALSFNTPNP